MVINTVIDTELIGIPIEVTKIRSAVSSLASILIFSMLFVLLSDAELDVVHHFELISLNRHIVSFL
jgi:hypothetical protein